MPTIILKVPNLPSWLGGAFKILVMAVVYGCWEAYRHGEIMSWEGLFEAVKDSLGPAAMATFTWLRMTHPSVAATLEAQRQELDDLKKYEKEN